MSKSIRQFINDYESHLRQEEKSRNTIAKYIRDLNAFSSFLDNRKLSKEMVLQWKESLTENYAPTSVNSMLAAINGFLEWANFSSYKVRPLKLQRQLFRKPEKELTRSEYLRLIQAAEQHQNKTLSLLMQTICSTGIRISEMPFITVEALHTGRTVAKCKGKSRTIFLPQELCRQLRRYCHENHIHTGIIFRTKNGNPLDRSNIWKAMKKLCTAAHIQPEKVFPHNLRHLFAQSYYTLEKDLSKLADLLGHSDIATTRIYTMESGINHAKQLDQMGLVVGAI